jgi:hypothetical protein
LIAQIDACGPVHLHFAAGGGAALVAAGAERVQRTGISSARKRSATKNRPPSISATTVTTLPASSAFKRAAISRHTVLDLIRREQDAFEIVDDSGDGG